MYRIGRFSFTTLLLLAFLAALSPALPVRPAYAAGIVVNTNADSTATDGLCTLREAIANANNDAATYPDCTAGSGADTITFAGSYTITLSSSLPDITDTDGLTITGAGASSTIVQAAASAGTATYRIVKINGASVSATLEYMTLRYGVEASGGAINVASSSLTLNYVAVSDNQVNNSIGTGLNGGAISINTGTLTINNSTLSNNSVTTSDSLTSRGNGGAIFAGTGTVNLNNTTVSGNSAKRSGGAIYSNGATVNVNYSTIANNTADSDNDADGDGGGVNRNSGAINLKSSIVAGNKKGSGTDNDCGGTITSQGYNLTGSSTGCSLSGTGDAAVTPSTVFTSVLGALANNGGQTYTHALIVGAAAIDAIPSGTNSCGSAPFNYDQRGGARPYNSSCDIGAYEDRPLAVSTSGADSGNCEVSDCRTIVYAYSQSYSGDTINVAAGTYTEASDINMTHSVTITGAGASSTIWQSAASAGAATHRFFKVSASMTVVVQNMTLRYGVEASGGAINIQGGSLTLNNLTISDNQVNNSVSTGLNGGAISMNGGTLTINNSTLSNNSVTTSDALTSRGNGGAIFVGSGTLNLNNVTISGNSAKRSGGAIYSNGGTVNVNYGTIANNTADSDNDADGDGGGVRRNSGAINLTSSIVAGNRKGPSADNDCSGTITSQGYNLTGSGSGCSLSGTGDVAVTPSAVFTSVLGSLADNGGATYTHLLYGGNAAQDAIPSGTNSCGTSPFTQDQRGSTRPYNSSCDIGAYESQDARPTVSMSSTAGDPATTSPIPVSVTFSESVTGFTSGDITAGNASVSNFSGSGASYSFDLTPSSDGTVTADIAAGVAQDSVLNTNTAAAQLSRSYDGSAPVVTSFTATSPTNSLNIPITAFTATDAVGVTGYLITTTSAAPSVGDAGWTASAPATYAVGSAGSYTLYAWAKDAAGHVSASASASVTVDTTAPAVAGISRFSITNPTNASSVDFFVVFSESSLSGLDASDFTLTTTGAISGASVSSVGYSGGASATVTVNTGSGDGSIRLDLADNDTITDAAGNKLGGTGAGNGDYTAGQSFTIDKTGPTVTLSSSASDPTSGAPIPVTVTFSESVSGFTSGDVTVGNASLSNFTGSGASYSFDLTPSSEGSVTADIAAGAAADSAGNGNSAATQFSRTYDSSVPSVTAFTATSPSASRNIPITAFTATDSLGVTGYKITEDSAPPSAGAAGWTASAPTVYTVAADGSYTLYPWAKDADGHVSAVYGAPASVVVDATAPTAGGLAAPNVALGGGATYSFTVVFSDNLAIDVASLDGNDIRVTGPGGFSQLAALASVSPAGNGSPRTATYQITPPGGSWDDADTGSYAVAVEANQVFDSVGNPVGARALGSFRVDLSYRLYLPLVVK